MKDYNDYEEENTLKTFFCQLNYDTIYLLTAMNSEYKEIAKENRLIGVCDSTFYSKEEFYNNYKNEHIFDTLYSLTKEMKKDILTMTSLEY